MGDKIKIVGMSIGVFIGVIVLVFILATVGLLYKSIFKPANENIDRKVFENTQSYVHGKRAELARMYQQYNEKVGADKDVIVEMVKIQFADFPANKILNSTLRNWLITIRGY